jgi:hypothetical protein
VEALPSKRQSSVAFPDALLTSGHALAELRGQHDHATGGSVAVLRIAGERDVTVNRAVRVLSTGVVVAVVAAVVVVVSPPRSSWS